MTAYREPGVALQTQGVWRHPTWCENRLNGCHCVECPGDWTGTGRESARCNAPRPARWWRRLVCRLRGRHKIVVDGCVVSCSTCLRILENPLEPIATRRYPQLEVGGGGVYVEAVIDSTPERRVYLMTVDSHRRLTRQQIQGREVAKCPSGSYCVAALGEDSTLASMRCDECQAPMPNGPVSRTRVAFKAPDCDYIFEDPVDGTIADLEHMALCRKNHTR